MITVGKWKVLVHTSKRGSVVAILSSTMAQFLKYADISCYLSACVVSFHVNKEAILLSIQIIKIFIFILQHRTAKPFLFTASKVYCTSGSYNNGYKYTYYITMGSNEKFLLCHPTRFHPFLGLLMNLHRVISLMC